MLANPMHNQDLLNRSETVSELRNQEMARLQGNAHHSAAQTRKKEVLRNETVQTTDSFQLNPDAQGEAEHQPYHQGEGKPEEEASSSSQAPHDHPRRLEGGEHLDIIA